MKKLVVVIALLLLSACGFEATETYKLTLSGAEAVPINGSELTTKAKVKLDENRKKLRAKLFVEDIEGFKFAHIHSGGIGQTGGVEFTFETPKKHKWKHGERRYLEVREDKLSYAQIEALLAGDWYINVHTDAVPSGEIRAQIVPKTTTIISFKVNGRQQVPAVMTDANGEGYLAYNSDAETLNMRVITQGIESAMAAHIHEGRVGNNGGVLVALNQDAEDANVWTAPTDTSLSKETFSNMLSGAYYTNFHTPAHQGGEIRGQVFSSDYSLYAFPMSGSQEVPPVTTDAFGDGYALLNNSNGYVELSVLTHGVDDAVAAHIHQGVSGSNGGVVVGLEQSVDNDSVWMTPTGTMLDLSQQEAFQTGGHYVNVHTPAVGSGEIRGQIVAQE
ncbi:CHRD domain-containing protein [Enterovibrio sp. ZSDZ42]|uniref:CHRD domain-containing protein n=1 Tax=Enterovibrio gelatinilyticus TaxID=2899819 RepID=A0ABT5R5F7_9GAMM|nr:CHRD domain-containing protein [Enterovibrio sp. ZSDZ42]MDD1795518.1 CHRD domain-containing protein [Enterovibrio sp. ZSDZ42]